MQFPGRSIERLRQILSHFSSRRNGGPLSVIPLKDWLATDRSLLSNSPRRSLYSCLPSEFARQVACHLDDEWI